MGLKIDGIAASSAIDTSSEAIDIENLDISSLKSGQGILNYEHRSPKQDGASFLDILGAVTFAKKIMSAEDCDTDRQKHYWEQIQLPFVYIQAELFDSENHPGAVCAAAIIKFYHSRGMPILVRFSIDGHTIERDGNVLRHCIARDVALTIKPANHSCVSGVIDEKAKKSGTLDELSRHEDGLIRLPGVEFQMMPPEGDVLERSEVLNLQELSKAMTAGGGMAAPGNLSGGAALAKEDVHNLKYRLTTAFRDWPRTKPLKEHLVKTLPDVHEDFLQKFVELITENRLRKASELHEYLKKALDGEANDGEKTKAFGKPTTPKPGAAPKPVMNDDEGDSNVKPADTQGFDKDIENIRASIHAVNPGAATHGMRPVAPGGVPPPMPHVAGLRVGLHPDEAQAKDMEAINASIHAVNPGAATHGFQAPGTAGWQRNQMLAAGAGTARETVAAAQPPAGTKAATPTATGNTAVTSAVRKGEDRVADIQGKFNNAPAAQPEEPPLTIRGKVIKPTPNVRVPHFDRNAGVFKTPRGSIPMYIPGRDSDAASKNFHEQLSDPKINAAHDYAVRQWARLNERMRAGDVPPLAIMHATLFSQLSPNTPVPIQELMHSIDGETILQSCNQQSKRIREFLPGDTVTGVDQNGQVLETAVVAIHDHGVLNGYEVTFDDGYQIVCSQNHKFLTSIGMSPLWEIIESRREIFCESETQKQWVAGKVRSIIPNGNSVQVTSEELHFLQSDLAAKKVGKCDQMASGKFREVVSHTSAGASGVQRLAKRESRSDDGRDSSLGEERTGRLRLSSEDSCESYAKMAKRESGKIPQSSVIDCGGGQAMASQESGIVCAKHSQNGRGPQNSQEWIDEFQGGILATQQRNVDLAGGTNNLWPREEANGFRFSGPQDLGGGRRVLAFLRSPVEGSETKSAEKYTSGTSWSRRNAQCGSAETFGRHVDSLGGQLFSVIGWKDEVGVADLAYSDAPLSSTWGLVSRKIVRVSSVGPRQMYDLEVAHGKHNFLLPNGVVTSNSHLVDHMKETGVDATDPAFGSKENRDAWKLRDSPDKAPTQSGEHWEGQDTGFRIKSKETKTGRHRGDFQPFNLADNKWKNMAKYHGIHDRLVELINRHKGDSRAAVRELMLEKNRGGGIPGLAPKTSRYMMGMLGGGNAMVPDTHFVRHIFGLDRKQDSRTIDYMKGLLWRNTVPGANDLDSMDDYYFRHHDAVKHMLEHPEHGKLFQKDPESAIFPAFWKHWVAIVPHERFRGMAAPKNSPNELTTHRPFWETVAPTLKAEEAQEDPRWKLAMKTAIIHREWADKYGEAPAMMLYMSYLLPHLMDAGDLKKAEDEGAKPKGPHVATLAAMPPAPSVPLKVRGNHVHPGELRYRSDLSHPLAGQTMKVVASGPDHYEVLKGSGPSAELNRVPKNLEGKLYEITRHPQPATVSDVVSPHHLSDGSKSPEQLALVSRLDFNHPKQTIGTIEDTHAAMGHPPWVQGNPKVFVKPSASYISYEHGAGTDPAIAETAFHNAARDAFGLGGMIPTTATFWHPHDGRLHSAMDFVHGAQHVEGQEDHENWHNQGLTQRMAVLDHVLGNNDRWGGNYMKAPDGSPKLIDHGFAFQYEYPFSTPEYVSPKVKHQPWTPDIGQWIQSINPQVLHASLTKAGVTGDVAQGAVSRLQNLHQKVATGQPFSYNTLEGK